MAIHNRSHHNHALMSLNKSRRDGSLKNKTSSDFTPPNESIISINIMDCCELLKELPDESIQLICIDPPYNLELSDWDIYDKYIDWASNWINESYRVLSKQGSMVIFGGIQFRDAKTGDLLDIIHYIRNNTNFKLINTIIWHYKNGMSAHRYFANRHEEAIWLTKTNDYYFDLDSVRVPYSEEELKLALKDNRLNPENTKKGKNPTNVWEIGRLNGNSKERVGHPTQKPLKIIDNFVKSLSYPGSTVLDFFAGSGTTGRVCVEENRHCLLCDTSETTLDFFEKHMCNIIDKNSVKYKRVDNVNEFFNAIAKEEKYE